MGNVSIDNGVLVIDGKRIKSKYDVTHYVVIGEVVVVRLKCEGRKDDINNVYGVKDGKIAWRVQDMLEYNPDYAPFMPNPYTYIKVYEKDPGIVLAGTFQGFTFLINPNNGRIIGTESWEK